METWEPGKRAGKSEMDEKKTGVQDVLDEFKKKSEELAKCMAAEKQNAMNVQIDNLRKDVKDLQAEVAVAKLPADPSAPA
jgi:hypothetical protein